MADKPKKIAIIGKENPDPALLRALRSIDEIDTKSQKLIMADKDWRPENWPECGYFNHIKGCNGDSICCAFGEQQASAMHKASVEHLDGRCTKHPIKSIDTWSKSGLVKWIKDAYYYLHKKDCPICYAVWAKGE